LNDLLRSYFLVFYAAGIAVISLRALPALFGRVRVAARPSGLRAHLPFVLISFHWLLPPIVILLRFGELSIDTAALRLFGLALSLYAAVLLLWAPLVLGRFLLPYAAVLEDHELVTSGPFRFVRHPVYSANLALFLGSALGTLNVCLLLLWPIAVLGFATEARIEERLCVTGSAEPTIRARSARALCCRASLGGETRRIARVDQVDERRAGNSIR
jgi:protein-S-isoprenylcysteine O-methyltransferase Ste14